MSLSFDRLVHRQFWLLRLPTWCQLCFSGCYALWNCLHQLQVPTAQLTQLPLRAIAHMAMSTGSTPIWGKVSLLTGPSTHPVTCVGFTWIMDCYAFWFILLYDGHNPAITQLQMHFMCWDFITLHCTGTSLILADYPLHLVLTYIMTPWYACSSELP